MMIQDERLERLLGRDAKCVAMKWSRAVCGAIADTEAPTESHCTH
jgi:hypothetical protein